MQLSKASVVFVIFAVVTACAVPAVADPGALTPPTEELKSTVNVTDSTAALDGHYFDQLSVSADRLVLHRDTSELTRDVNHVGPVALAAVGSTSVASGLLIDGATVFNPVPGDELLGLPVGTAMVVGGGVVLGSGLLWSAFTETYYAEGPVR